jgi:hypothetical protein
MAQCKHESMKVKEFYKTGKKICLKCNKEL